MRVANVVLEGRFGGPQHRIAQVAAVLQDRGVETTVVLPRRGSERFRAELDERGVAYRALRIHNLSRQPREALVWALTFVPELVALTIVLRRLRSDVVHCNGVWQPKAVLAGRLAGSRVVLHLNDTRESRLLRLLFRAVAPLCHGFALAGERVRAHYLTTPALRRKPAKVIQAPVDVARFDPGAVGPAAMLGAGPCHVVTVGNVNPDKGIEHFVAAAGMVARVRPEVRFHVFGAVTPRQAAYCAAVAAAAARLPAGTVELHGPVDDVPGVLAAADLYVCSSVAEASPLSVWEAMAMELAVVSTDVGDVARIAADAAGLVVPAGDARALADAILELLADPERRRTMGMAGRAVATAELDLHICAARHHELYRQVATQRGGCSVWRRMGDRNNTVSRVTSAANSRLRRALMGRERSARMSFHNYHYLRNNARRLEHLASLGLPIAGKSVLEVGAGIGDHSHFFLDRGCRLTITEPRRENLDILRERYPDVPVFHLDLEAPGPVGGAPFEIVYCYGVLYHLRKPAEALAELSRLCSGMLLLSTCVSFGSESAVNLVDEDRRNPTQALSGIGCRPTRPWLFEQLQKHFEYVYVPRTQPNHPEFPLDWSAPEEHEGLSRAVFVASRVPLDFDVLTTELPTLQLRQP